MRKTTKQESADDSSFVAKRVKEVGIIAFAALGVFFLVALMSYSATDGGWSTATSITERSNAAGLVGAFIADWMLAFFGYLAYLLPGITLLIGYLLYKSTAFKKHATIIWYFNIVGLLFAVSGACALVDLSFGASATSKLPGPSGGIIGNVLTTWLVGKFSTTGSVLICMSMFMIGITIGTGASWIHLMEFLGRAVIQSLGSVKSLFSKIKLRTKKEPVTFIKSESRQIEPRMSDAPQLVQRSAVSKSKIEIVSPQLAPKAAIKKNPSVKKISNGKLPDLELLEPAPPSDPKKHYSKAVLESLSREVEEHLLDFGAEVKVVAV